MRWSNTDDTLTNPCIWLLVPVKQPLNLDTKNRLINRFLSLQQVSTH